MLRDLLGKDADKAHIVADDESRQLLLRGTPEAIALAEELVQRLDVPPVKKAQPPRDTRRVIRTYDVPDTATAKRTLEQQFGSDVTTAESPATGRIVVRATETVHEEINRWLTRPETAAPANEQPPAELPLTNPPLWQSDAGSQKSAGLPARTTREIRFVGKSAAAIESASFRLLGERLAQRAGDSYEFTSRDGRTVTLRFDTTEHTCELNGERGLVEQFASLLQRLDRMPRDGDTNTRFIRVRNLDPKTLRQTIRALQRAGLRPPQRQSAVSPAPRAVIRLASFQEEEPANENPAAQQQPQLRRPASDLEIESLPDLDVIILRGRDPDIEELTRLIREIERIAETTAPEIEIYPLKHVQGSAIDQLIDDVLDDLTGTLQGRVTITPLVKPNALLLIGWGEAVKAVKELIMRLDQPVRAETQVRIFALRHAAAAQVQTTIQQFLTTRGGLGPQAIITADTRTNSLIVNAAPRDMLEVELLVRRLDVAESESVNRGRIVRLRNTLAPDMAATVEAALTAARGGDANGRSAILEMMLDGPDGEQLLKSGLLDDVRVTADPRTNTLFVSGPPKSIALVEALIGRLDESPAASAQLKVFPITNGDAGELVLVLRSLFPAAATTSTVPQLATASGETSLVPVRFSVDARTNTVIATGSAGDLEVVEALIRRLDLDGAQERINRVYRLENSPAIDVAQAVNEFLRSERIVQQAAPGRLNAFQQIESEVVVVPEPVGNSLIISATPRFYDEIIELVESLDEQPPQVLIQVVLAEVQLGDLHEFGVELGLQDSLLFDRGLLGDLLTTTNSTTTSTPAGVVTETMEIIRAASLTPGFDFNNKPLGNSGSDLSLSTASRAAGQALSHFSLGRMNSDLAYGGLVLSASSENVSVLIRALNQTGRFEVLSRPQIMTLDNQPASILVGQRVPRVVGTSVNQVGQVNQIELEDVGLILGVTPRISPDGLVVMEVDAEKSDLGRIEDGIPVSVSAEGQVVRSPSVNITRAQTTVSAASGQTIVIGGLITNSEQSITRSVPWLSQIPLLGELFKYDSFDNERKELLIILTPRVIRNREDAEHIKQLEMARISWSSSDAFDWTAESDSPPASGTLDESGVQTIYPDATPGLEWNQPPVPDRAAWEPVKPGAGQAVQEPADPEAEDFQFIEPASFKQPAKSQKRFRWPFRRDGAQP